MLVEITPERWRYEWINRKLDCRADLAVREAEIRRVVGGRGDCRADEERADRRARSRLTVPYHFGGNRKLELEPILEKGDSRLDCRLGCRAGRRDTLGANLRAMGNVRLGTENNRAAIRAAFRAALRTDQWFGGWIYRQGQARQSISKSGNQIVAEEFFGCIPRYLADRRAALWTALVADQRVGGLAGLAARRAELRADREVVGTGPGRAGALRAALWAVLRANDRSDRRVKSWRFSRDQALCVTIDSLAEGIYAIQVYQVSRPLREADSTQESGRRLHFRPPHATRILRRADSPRNSAIER